MDGLARSWVLCGSPCELFGEALGVGSVGRVRCELDGAGAVGSAVGLEDEVDERSLDVELDGRDEEERDEDDSEELEDRSELLVPGSEEDVLRLGRSGEDGESGVAVGAGAAGPPAELDDPRSGVDAFGAVVDRGRSDGLVADDVARGAGASGEFEVSLEVSVAAGSCGFACWSAPPPLAACSGPPNTLPATDPS